MTQTAQTQTIPATTDEACNIHDATPYACRCGDAINRQGGSYILEDGSRGCKHRHHRIAQAKAQTAARAQANIDRLFGAAPVKVAAAPAPKAPTNNIVYPIHADGGRVTLGWFYGDNTDGAELIHHGPFASRIEAEQAAATGIERPASDERLNELTETLTGAPAGSIAAIAQDIAEKAASIAATLDRIAEIGRKEAAMIAEFNQMIADRQRATETGRLELSDAIRFARAEHAAGLEVSDAYVSLMASHGIDSEEAFWAAIEPAHAFSHGHVPGIDELPTFWDDGPDGTPLCARY